MAGCEGSWLGYNLLSASWKQVFLPTGKEFSLLVFIQLSRKAKVLLLGEDH